MMPYAPEGDPTDYHYDLESLAVASLGGRVWPSLSRVGSDGYRHVIGWTGDKQQRGYAALRSLVGCLDAPLGEDEDA